MILVNLLNPRPGRGIILAGLRPKGMCDLKNSRHEAKIGVKATSFVGG